MQGTEYRGVWYSKYEPPKMPQAAGWHIQVEWFPPIRMWPKSPFSSQNVSGSSPPPFREFLCTYDTYVCAFQDWDSKESSEFFVKKTPPYLVGKKTLVAWKKSYQSHQAGFAGDDDVSKRQQFFQGGWKDDDDWWQLRGEG